jgi:glycerol-3-phosphate O-acyltransferase
VRVVAAEGAGGGELAAEHGQRAPEEDFSIYVVRRARLALERAERRIRGNRYKVPKFVHEEISSRPAFRQGAVEAGAARGLPPERALARAAHYLREIAADHSPFVIDLVANAIHWLYRQGYGAIVYDPQALREVASLSAEHPVVFLPSHRSMMDRLSLQYVLWENDLPPNHTAGGINMNFFPVGPLIRRTGVFFIRRSFKDNPLYKHVLRAYLDYLVEKRFSLEWYMEGGRSRTGKLLPPRYGLLSYVVDSVRRGKAEDLYLLPISIAYDQIQDLADYAVEAQGGDKQRESFTWMVKAIRSLRRRYGNIHIRFGEPLAVSKEIAPASDPDQVSTGLAKLAFEVMYRIGQITPVTPTSLVSIALLKDEGRARTSRQLANSCRELDGFVERRHLPTTEKLRLEDPTEVAAVLRQLEGHGSVSVYREGSEPVYHLTPHQAHLASYYRNMVVHFFVPGAISELALAAAAESEEPLSTLWQEVWRLRDLLKFEFFFSERGAFAAEITRELEDADAEWEARVAAGQAVQVLQGVQPLKAHWAVLPLLDAYQVVGDVLADWRGPVDEKPFLARCLKLARQYRLQGVIFSDESVSTVLFKSALALARNRDLVEGEEAGMTAARHAFCNEIRRVRLRATHIAEMDRERSQED